MTVIFGAGELGRYIRKTFFSGRQDIVYYDNDRRKWGKEVEDIKVVDFDRFIELARKENAEIILAAKSTTAVSFLRDVCSPENRVYSLKDDELIAFDLNGVDRYERNIPGIEMEKLKKCKEKRDLLAQQGKKSAYEHAKKYINFKQENLYVPEITGIELTNYCNLQCPDCPTPKSTREKGFMNDEIFNLALSYVSPCPVSPFSLHGLGEPLLHPRLSIYLERLAELDINIIISTNGLLLEKELAEKVFSILNSMSQATVYISFHTQRSVSNWLKFLKLVEKKGTHINFYGQVLAHNKPQAEQWLKEAGISNPEKNPYIRYITSHSFAGNVSERKKTYDKIEVANRVRNCTFLNNNITSVAWNGLLKTCCYDSECTGICGTIFEFEKARNHPDGYVLCNSCDPDWTSGYQ